MKSQKEINLGKDLELRDRKDVYRNFLLFCVSGDVVQLPMGSTGAHLLCQAVFSTGTRGMLACSLMQDQAAQMSQMGCDLKVNPH